MRKTVVRNWRIEAKDRGGLRRIVRRDQVSLRAMASLMIMMMMVIMVMMIICKTFVSVANKGSYD
jgi:hypothetical protein